ncbi:lipase family protein [Nocardia sp. IFM 10818]
MGRPQYAPELNIVGVAAEGSLPEGLRHNNGGVYSGLITAAIEGLANEYPEVRRVLEKNLDPLGRAVRRRPATHVRPLTRGSSRDLPPPTTPAQPAAHLNPLDPAVGRLQQAAVAGGVHRIGQVYRMASSARRCR